MSEPIVRFRRSVGRRHKRVALLTYSCLLLVVSPVLPGVIGHPDTLGLENLPGGVHGLSIQT